jgi:hypothetical protein
VIYSGPAADALTPLPAGRISDWGALALATALFVIVICTVATDDRAAWKGVTAPLLIGLFIFTDAISRPRAARSPRSGRSTRHRQRRVRHVVGADED